MTNMIRDWMTPTQKLIWLYRKGGSCGSSGVEKTVKASLVHVEDALAKNAKMVKAYIEPVQSGSGDPSPDNVRPITGHTGVEITHTGKNLLDPNSPYLEDTLIGTDGSQGSNSNFNTWRFSSPNTFTVSINVTETTNPGRVVVFNANGSVSTYEAFSGTVGRRAISKTLTSGQYALISIRKSATDYQLEVGTETTYAPYNGTTYSVTFPALGKNLLDNTSYPSGTKNNVTFTKNSDGSWTTNNTASALSVYCIGQFDIKSGETYTLSGCLSGGGASSYRLDVRSDANTIYNNWFDTGGGYADATKTATEDKTLYVYIRIANGYDASGKTFYPMIRKSTESATYEPYTNTVYSGTLDVLTGVLTVDKTCKYLDSFNWVWGTNNTFFVANTQDGDETYITTDSDILCSAYKYKAITGASGTGVCMSGKYMRIRDTTYASPSDFKTAMSGNQVLYRLNTPLTYQLTPTQITMLLGENNIWASTGDVTVKYKASAS